MGSGASVHRQTQLNNWWNGLQSDGKVIEDPQVAFRLQKGDRTILFFGEYHNDIHRKCDPDQVAFIDLFQMLVVNKLCKSTNFIVEVTEEYIYEKNYQYPPKRRIDRLVSMYFQTYGYGGLDDCLYCCNPSRMNATFVKCGQNLEDINYIKQSCMIYEEPIIQFITKTHALWEMLRDVNIYGRIPTEVNKLQTEYFDPVGKVLADKNIVKNMQAIISGNPSKTTIRETVEYVRWLSWLQMVMLTILHIFRATAANKNALVYQGTLHVLQVVKFLIYYCGYKLTGVSKMILDNKNVIDYHCMTLTSDVKKGLETLRESNLYTDAKHRDFIDAISAKV